MTPTKQPKRTHLTICEKTVSFSALTKSISSAPEIALQLEDLKAAQRGLWTATEDDNEVTAHMSVCVHPQSGHYVVLCNWGRVQKFLDDNAELPAGQKPGVLKVRLISKQLMKHISTITVPADKQNAVADKVEREIQAGFQEQFDQRPRYGDRPQRPYQQRDDGGYRQQSDRPTFNRRPG